MELVILHPSTNTCGALRSTAMGNKRWKSFKADCFLWIWIGFKFWTFEVVHFGDRHFPTFAFPKRAAHLKTYGRGKCLFPCIHAPLVYANCITFPWHNLCMHVFRPCVKYITFVMLWMSRVDCTLTGQLVNTHALYYGHRYNIIMGTLLLYILRGHTFASELYVSGAHVWSHLHTYTRTTIRSTTMKTSPWIICSSGFLI